MSSRGGPLARTPAPPVRAILPRQLPASTSPATEPPRHVVYMQVPTPVYVQPPPPPPPPPPPQNNAPIDGPAIGGLVALGAFAYFAFLREPEPRELPPDPFSSTCPHCNPLIAMGMPPTSAGVCTREHTASEEEDGESNGDSPAAIILIARHR